MASLFDLDLDRFASVVRRADPRDLVAHPALLLARAGRVSVHWAPFERTPTDARVVLVGITPGRQQAQVALDAFRQALLGSAEIETALERAKASGSFAGPVRRNLIDMLDHVGLHDLLDIPSSAELFSPAPRVPAHFTSALRYPVFVDGANYNGTPDMLHTSLLRSMVDELLASEARTLPDALWVPLGPKPSRALRYLVERGILHPSRVLDGLPHPSGANAESVALWTGRKCPADASRRRPPGPILAARAALRAQLAQLRGAWA